MNKNLIFAFLSLVICCSPTKKDRQVTDSTITSNPHVVVKTPVDTTGNEKVEEDCVFNDDYYGLTVEWLKELNKRNFIWRSNLNQALLPMGQDTVFISKGGCYHFGISVELKLTNDNHLISDSTYWIQTALQLADNYKMEHYSKMIKKGQIRKVQNSELRIWYEVDDDNENDNFFYNGIEITFAEKVKRINITEYYN